LSSRRSPLEIYRDALLVLAMDEKPIKRTNFMYALQMSWTPFTRLLDDLIDKKLVVKIDPFEYRKAISGQGRFRRRKVDGRTRYLVTITMKGHYVLRWLDELLKYIVDDSDPGIRPPLWILQTLFRHRIEDLKVDAPDPFTAMQRPLDVNMPGLQFRLLPLYRLMTRDLLAKFVVAEQRIIYNASNELIAEFEVKGKRRYHLFCPECGKKIASLRGLKIHIGRMHEEKKEELWRKVELYLKHVPKLTLE
jgi:predicted transcriptional regulator